MQRNQAGIGVGASALLALLGLSLVAFGGDLRLNREMARAAGAQPSALPAGGNVQTAIYVRVDGIEGGATEKERGGWSQALSFSHGLTTARAAASGAGAGKTMLKDIVITKAIDKASPKLAQAACEGSHHKLVRIEVTRPSPKGNMTFYAYELTDVLITSYQVNGSAGAQGLLTEEISFNFRAIKTTYTEYDSGGVSKGTVTCSYKSM